MSTIILLGQVLCITDQSLGQTPCVQSWAPFTTPVFPTFQSPTISFVIKEFYNLHLEFAIILIEKCTAAESNCVFGNDFIQIYNISILKVSATL